MRGGRGQRTDFIKYLFPQKAEKTFVYCFRWLAYINLRRFRALAPPILFRSSCYTDGNGPEVFMQCSTKWIRNFDKSKDEYGDWTMTESPHVKSFSQMSTRTLMEVMVVKKLYHRQVRKTKFVRNFMRKLDSWKMIQIGRSLTITLWKNFCNVVRPSPCSFPLMRSGLTILLTDLSFKEDYAVSEQQQNLLFLNSKWTIWMVCNLQGRVDWIYFEFGVLQRGAKEGERGFCPKQSDIDPKNPDEVAWPNATEVSDD